MTLWQAVLVAGLIAFVTKLAGYAVPARWLQNPRMTRVAGAMTVAVGAGAVYFWAQERFLGGQYGEDEGNAVDYGGGTTGCGAGRTVLGRR